jgi:hypothetical protein
VIQNIDIHFNFTPMGMLSVAVYFNYVSKRAKNVFILLCKVVPKTVRFKGKLNALTVFHKTLQYKV